MEVQEELKEEIVDAIMMYPLTYTPDEVVYLMLAEMGIIVSKESVIEARERSLE